MKTKPSNILLTLGIFIGIIGLLFKILHYSIGFFTGGNILYFGIIISCIALIWNIFFIKKS